MAPPYIFRPMTTADLPLVQRWLPEPHVAEWWRDPEEQFEFVSGDLDEPAMDAVHRVAGPAGRSATCSVID